MLTLVQGCLHHHVGVLGHLQRHGVERPNRKFSPQASSLRRRSSPLVQSKRLYHIVTTLITIFAACSYFAMAAGHGISYHHVVERESHKHVPDTKHDIFREVYWARYVDWSLTTPLLLLDLCLLAGISGGHIVITMVADEIMIITGLFAAFGSESTPQKWGWYAIACIAYLVVIWQLAVQGRGMAMNRGGKVGNFFAAIGGFTLIIWTVYPM